MNFDGGREFEKLSIGRLFINLKAWSDEFLSDWNILKGKNTKDSFEDSEGEKMAILKICAADENLLDTRCRCPYRRDFKFERILKAREKH